MFVDTYARRFSRTKEELVLCFMGLVKNNRNEGDEDVGTAEEWINIINRGGVKSTTY